MSQRDIVFHTQYRDFSRCALVPGKRSEKLRALVDFASFATKVVNGVN